MNIINFYAMIIIESLTRQCALMNSHLNQPRLHFMSLEPFKYLDKVLIS